MLAITSHNKLLKEAMDKYGTIQKMAPFLAEWMEKCFGMTATLPKITRSDLNVNMSVCVDAEEEMDVEIEASEIDPTGIEQQNQEQSTSKLEHPSTFNCSDRWVLENPLLDTFNSFNKLQMHHCNLYCMRTRKVL